MQTLQKIPGMGLELETTQGGFCIDTVRHPNPGSLIMEEWKTIKNYPRYEISNLGNVKSNTKWSNGKNLKSALSKGYYSCALQNGNGQRTQTIHRLVAEAFIPKPKGKTEINHKNGITTDNRISNLEWVTRTENIIHAYKIGLNKNSKYVQQFNFKGELIETYYSRGEAERCTGIWKENIKKACQGKLKTAGGYIWKYK